jgi:transcriptional regulator with XRE-family HTH domain
MSLYSNIDAERGRVNMSKSEISNKLGIDRKTYDNWMENGKIPASALVTLSEIFDVSIDYLLGRTDIRSLRKE